MFEARSVLACDALGGNGRVVRVRLNHRKHQSCMRLTRKQGRGVVFVERCMRRIETLPWALAGWLSAAKPP